MDEFQRRHLQKIDRQKSRKADRPQDGEEPLPDPVTPIASGDQPGRNDPCSCGSGKKYKKCCGKPG